MAFRSILGWRHSWLSREAIVFGLFAPLGIGAALYAVTPHVEGGLPDFAKPWLATFLPPALRPVAELGAILAGALGVYCSARIYQFTGRTFWRGRRTHLKFFGSAAVLGAGLVLACLTAAEALTAEPTAISLIIAVVVLVAIGKLAYEFSMLMGNDTGDETNVLTSRIMTNDLRGITTARYALGLLGGAVFPVAVAVSGVAVWPAAVFATLGCVCLLGGELLERTLYFSAVVPLRMPGGVKS